MQSTRSLLPAALAAALLLPTTLPAAAQTTFNFQLFGQAQRPPVATDAQGACTGVLAADESTFTLSCEHTVEGATAAAVHRGFGDESGAAIFDLGAADSPVQAVWDLDEDEAIRLLAGGLYVNVASMDHAGGEIRGQILPTQPLAGRRIAFPLRGAQQVPPVSTGATGACVADLDFTQGAFIPPKRVTIDLRCAHDVASPTGAALHVGERGANGNAIVDLGAAGSPLQATVELRQEPQVNRFFAGDVYVNVTSDGHGAGELRGQVEGCIDGPNTLCLNDGRFELQLLWNTDDDVGPATAVRQAEDSGLFWFFRPTNLEMLVKVLDGCAVNGHYWLFYAATTNVGFDLRVTDKRTRFTKTYSNERGDPAVPQLDTGAFATCP
jgi:hypothetical protein